MAEKIKKFFAKKKADTKFKLAGPGRRLDDSSTSVTPPSKPAQSYVPSTSGPSEAKKQAAEAALARLNNQRQNSAFNTSLAAIQAQVKRELEAERKAKADNVDVRQPGPVEVELEASSHLAVKGVYFKCPMISDEVLTKEQWKARIKEFLYQQLEEERGLTACLIIHSCNYNRTKVNECVDVLVRYLDNLVGNPTEPKFHKIRCSNAAFADKVLPVVGATDLLYAAGFRLQKMEYNGQEEDFWVFNPENVDGIETLEFLRDALKSEDRIELEVDRNLQVLYPAQAAVRVDLPQDFYAISPEELKKEQQLRSEIAEKQLQLRTKAMREKDELREIRKYKFALIRIRFPDGLYLQGTFSVYEKFSEVVAFVQENLETRAPFVLKSPTGHNFEESDRDQTLFQLRLVPATILTFQWDADIAKEMASVNSFLKPEVMMLVQSL